MTDGVKRSVTIAGHRTSVSLEAPFWDALRDIARARKMSVNRLITEIDAAREPGTGLSGALRVYVLAYYRNQGEAASLSSSGNEAS